MIDNSFSLFARDAIRRARHSMSSICPSVCEVQVCFSHSLESWNTLKIIVRLIGLRFMLWLTPTRAIWSNSQNSGGIWVVSKKPAIGLYINGARYDEGYYDG